MQSIHRTFLIVLPGRLKFADLVFFFLFGRKNVLDQKIGCISDVLRARSGAQFVQACFNQKENNLNV